MRQIKAAMIDWDGTMADSEKPRANGIRRFVEQYGGELTWEDYRQTMTLRGLDIVDFLMRRFPGINGDKEELNKRRLDLMREESGKGLALMPGAFELPDRLRRLGINMVGVASDRDRQSLIDQITALGMEGKFDAVVSTEDLDGIKKPNPRIYLETAGKLGVLPEECVVFEDTAYGVKAALRAGVGVVIHVHDLRYSEFSEGAHYILSTLSEVRDEMILPTGLGRERRS